MNKCWARRQCAPGESGAPLMRSGGTWETGHEGLDISLIEWQEHSLGHRNLAPRSAPRVYVPERRATRIVSPGHPRRHRHNGHLPTIFNTLEIYLRLSWVSKAHHAVFS